MPDSSGSRLFLDTEGVSKQIKPSRRGELEITCINHIYLENKQLFVVLLGRGFTWIGELKILVSIRKKKKNNYMLSCWETINLDRLELTRA